MKRENTMRKLNDTSWLAQVIQDKMDVEFDKNRGSSRWNCLHTLHIIVNEADNPDNDNIYYSNDYYPHARSIIIRKIPSLMKHGSDFDISGMQAKLRGIAERYTDEDGQYIVSVSTTFDLNSAVIKDISELMFQMGTH